MPRILGLDEAGRGCVLGPLVIGCAYADQDDPAGLRAAGANDSKLLSAARRAQAAARLESLVTHRLVLVSPQEIDEGNINTLEEAAFAALINEAAPDTVYIDAPVNPRGIPAFRARLIARLTVPLPAFIIEPKADATYPIVGAASIFAKLRRDAEIAVLGAVGSGYPSDPVTRAWLRGFIDRAEPFPACVRTRWATLDNLRQQPLLGG